MEWGLEVKNNVKTLLKVTDRVTRVLYVRTLPANETSSVQVPGFSIEKGAVITVPLSAGRNLLPHQYRIAGDVISWRAGPPSVAGGASTRTDSLLVVFLFK